MKLKFLTLTILFFTYNCIAQTPPTNQATNLNFSSTKTYKTSMSITPSADADGYLVVLNTGPVNFTPVNNTTYHVGDIINGNKIVKVGGGSFFFIKNLLQNNTYQVAIFAYNQNGNNIAYKTDNPLTGTFTTASDSYGNYYDGIDVNSGSLTSQLTALIQPHDQIPYGMFDENIVKDFFEHDTTINGTAQHYVRCQYSNEQRLYTGTFAYNSPNPSYNREHRVPFTWINFNGIQRSDFEDTDEGCDVHALELLNADVNSSRSNYPFGDVTSNPWADSYLGYTKGRDANNNIVAEPMDERKGDVARAVLYMCLAYNGKYGQNWGIDNLLSNGPDQDIQTLIDWHFADLPDDFEKTRHSYVYEKQHNRNPLIDFPELVNCIDFSDVTQRSGTCNVDFTTGIKPIKKTKIGHLLYPNPSNGMVYFKDEIKESAIKTIRIFNMIGAEVYTFSYNNDSLDMSQLSKGQYIISLENNEAHYLSKIMLK